MLDRPAFAPPLLAWGVAVPFIYGPANALAMSATPSERRGSVGGVLETAPQVGATLGIAVVGAIVVGSHGTMAPIAATAFEAGFLATAGAMAAATLGAGALLWTRGDHRGA